MQYEGTWFSGEILVVDGWLDWMILEVLTNLNDSMILIFLKPHAFNTFSDVLPTSTYN